MLVVAAAAGLQRRTETLEPAGQAAVEMAEKPLLAAMQPQI